MASLTKRVEVCFMLVNQLNWLPLELEEDSDMFAEI